MSTLSQTCTRLLAHGQRYQPLYRDRLANHLPMALIALERMGAGDTRLSAFASGYEGRLALRVPLALPLESRETLSGEEAFERALMHVQGEIKAHGAEPILRLWLPVLLPGIAASAFHCVIWLAYAVDAQDEPEIAAALAYWITAFEPLAPLGRLVDRAPEQIAGDVIGDHAQAA